MLRRLLLAIVLASALNYIAESVNSLSRSRDKKDGSRAYVPSAVIRDKIGPTGDLETAASEKHHSHRMLHGGGEKSHSNHHKAKGDKGNREYKKLHHMDYGESGKFDKGEKAGEHEEKGGKV